MLYAVIKQCLYGIEQIQGIFTVKSNAEQYANTLNNESIGEDCASDKPYMVRELITDTLHKRF